MMLKKRPDRVTGRYSSDKFGQVTAFIIIGLIILLAAALVFVLRDEITQLDPGEIFPTSKSSIEQGISLCINDLGEEALHKAGQQGGYLEVPVEIRDDQRFHIRTSPFTLIPIWAYGTQTLIPPLENIKREVDLYIKDNLRSCVYAQQEFQTTYDLIEKSEITVDTIFADSQVQFNVHWEVEMHTQEDEIVAQMTDHKTSSPIKFKRIWQTAKTITEREMETLKLEDITQDLIALEHPKVPVAGTDISCSAKTWNPIEAENALRELIRVNIAQLKVAGSNYVEHPVNMPYYQNHYVWNIGESFINNDVSVNFAMASQAPFHFAVRPLSSGMMKSSEMGGSSYLPALCLQTWKFSYDVTYPIITTLRDETTGYDFNMALMVHVNKNYPDRNQAAIVPLNIAKRSAAGSSEDYCAQAKIPMTVKTYQFVDNQLGTSYRDDLWDVELTFSCLRYSCSLGASQYDFASSGFSGLITNVPTCVGGIVRAHKDNYKDAWQRVVTSEQKVIELDLIPLKPIKVSDVKILTHELLDGGSLGIAQELDDEMAMVTLRHLKQNSSEVIHESRAVLSNQFDPSLQEPLELLAGADFEYQVEIQLLDEDNLLGGYKGNWTARWSELQNGQSIEFHAVTKKRANLEEQAQILFNLAGISGQVGKPEIR